jgi:hypothetical protein
VLIRLRIKAARTLEQTEDTAPFAQVGNKSDSN